MDNKQSRNFRDRDRVDLNDRSEVEYLHHQWKQFSHEDIVKAIKEHGPVRKDIED